MSPFQRTTRAIGDDKVAHLPQHPGDSMRRALALALVAAALLAWVPGSTAASHGPSAYRTAAGSYSMAGGATLGSTGTFALLAPTITDTARATEDSVAIAVKDTGASVVAL